MLLYNCYAFTRAHERVVIDMGLPYDEALRKCEYEVAFIESMGDKLTRFNDNWYADGLIPRVVMYDVKADPFTSVHYEERYRKPVWLPDSSEL